MPRRRDTLWEHIEQEDDGKVLRCTFCKKTFRGSGITRMRYHFAKINSKEISPCSSVSDVVHEMAIKAIQRLGEKGKRPLLTDTWTSTPADSCSHLFTRSKALSLIQESKKSKADMAIIKYIIDSDLSVGQLHDPKFKEMCVAIANAGPGYEIPTSESKLLDDLKTEVGEYVQSIKQSWEKFGCTLVLLSRTFGGDMFLLAACPRGVVFLDLLNDETGCSENNIFQLVSLIIDVIGPQNVIQIMSDDHQCDVIGLMVQKKYPNIFSITNCMGRMEKVFSNLSNLDFIRQILDEVRKVTNVVHKWAAGVSYSMGHTVNMPLPKHYKHFEPLQCLLIQELEISYMADSTEWRNLMPWNKEVVEVHNIIKENYFWESGKKLFHVVESLMKVWSMAYKNCSTTGYIYSAIIMIEKDIRECFKEDSEKISSCLNIIDDLLKKYILNDMHVAAAYLNPHLYFNGRVTLDDKVRMSLDGVIQRMVPNETDRKDLAIQLGYYHGQDQTIFSPPAIDALHVSHPRLWWDAWGDSVKILQTLAIKILSQPSSSTRLTNLNWCVYNEPEEKLAPLSVWANMHMMKKCANMEEDEKRPIDLDDEDGLISKYRRTRFRA